MLEADPACARCGQVGSADELRLWMERRRLRLFAEGAFHNVHQNHYHAVCEVCFSALSCGGGVQDIRARRGVVALLAMIALAAATAALTPAALPSLKSAFWRNCLKARDCPSAPNYW